MSKGAATLEGHSSAELKEVEKLLLGTILPPSSAPADPADAAKVAGLRYISDTRPGITRKRSGDEFEYFSSAGEKITDERTLARIRSLAIPPAYTDVWICPSPNGHIQATARDARGRKQYRYHERWREVRDVTKYDRAIAFAEMLPTIRSHIAEDLAAQRLSREKVLATIVRLMELTAIRVGNREYATTNRHYGLTTFENRHANVSGSTIHFHFRGKSGKIHQIDVRDKQLARIVKRCQDLPGQELFEYVTEDGRLVPVDSADVNQYLREITGMEFSAKDFRTWAGTVMTAITLGETDPPSSEAQAKKAIAEAVQIVARVLGNTPAVCRKNYIHPVVLESYLNGKLHAALERYESAAEPDTRDKDPAGLRPDEAAVLALLRDRLERKTRPA